MNISYQAGHLKLDFAGLKLTAGAPAVVLANELGTALQTLHITGEATLVSHRRRGPSGDLTIHTWTWLLDGGHRLAWTLGLLADGIGCTVNVSFYNGAVAPVFLRELHLLTSGEDGLMVTGDPASWLLTTLESSTRIADLGETLPSANEDECTMWAAFGQPVPHEQSTGERNVDGRWRGFTDFAIVANAEHALAIGAVGDPEAAVALNFRVEGARNQVAFVSEMSDVEVASGAWRRGQEIALLGGEQSDITARLLRWCAATHGARTHAKPASGWCSWYHYTNTVAAADVIAIADHVRHTGLAMPVIQIDDGFQRQVGDWACNERFPDGWQPVIERIHAAGAVAGVWLAPLAVHESTDLFRTHRSWCQHAANGLLAGEASNWGPRSRWLDPTHPEVAAWIRDLIREHRVLGFRYFKIDFNTIAGVSARNPHGARLHDRSRTAFQALRDLYRLYREEMGEDSYLLACIGFNRAVAGYADAARIGPDSCPRWDSANPCCIRECIRAMGQNAQANGILFANDPDVSYTRTRETLTEPELKTWHGFVGLLGGLSLISEPLTVPDLILGDATLCLHADFLEVDVTVVDHVLVRHEVPWYGSNVELFVEVSGAVRQFWLQPGVGTSGARALRAALPTLLVEPRIVVTTEPATDGYHLRAKIPLELLSPAGPHELRCELIIDTVAELPAITPRRQRLSIFGTISGQYASTAGYGVVRAGTPSHHQLGRRGWVGTDRMYEILAPPIPERGASFSAHDREHRRFGFVARRDWGEFAVAQVWNPAATPADGDLDVAALLGEPVHVWSFWDGVYHGIHDGSFCARNLAPHGSMVLRLTPVDRTVPTIVGSDLHLGCGAAELAMIEATPEKVHLVLHDAGAREGSLWLAWPGELRLHSSTRCTARLERISAELWRLAVAARERGGPQRIEVICDGSEALGRPSSR